MLKVSQAVFDRAGRDIESIGLGVIEPSQVSVAGWPLDAETSTEVLRSVTRILGTSKRFAGGPIHYRSANVPTAVAAYLKKVAKGRCDEETLIDSVSAAFQAKCS